MDPEQSFTMQLLMSSAVLMNSTGFVEQRIMTALSAIEQSDLGDFKNEGRREQRQYDKLVLLAA